MTPAQILAEATRAGVAVTLTEAGTLKLKGDPAAVAVIAPLVREHKPEIVQHLAAPNFAGIDPELVGLIRDAARYWSYSDDDLHLVCGLARKDPLGLRLALLSDPLRPFYHHKTPLTTEGNSHA